MFEHLNDGARWLIARAIWTLALFFRVLVLWRLRTYSSVQRALRRELGLTSEDRPQPYGPSVANRIEQARRVHWGSVEEAYTSGTLRERKRILYPARRILEVRWAFFESYSRAFRHLKVRRTSLFVVAPAAGGGSLTSLLLRESSLPSWMVRLQAPYRVQSSTCVRKASAQYGEAAVRALLMTVSNPGVWYATNPSTLTLLVEDVRTEWPRFQALVQAVLGEESLQPLNRLLQSLSSIGARERLAQVARSSAPIPWTELFPALEAVICWDGGYVQPFLEKLRTELPHVRLIPMFSMSTEAIETLPMEAQDAAGSPDLAFLPLAPGTLYEFVSEGESDALLRPEELQVGGIYSLVVSDRYGLQRYQTDDLFCCVRKVHGLPDLRFVRRANLSFSFTGEKLTGEQLSQAFRSTEDQLPHVRQRGFMTCFPSRGRSGEVPHYKIIWTVEGEPLAPSVQEQVRASVESHLKELNSELRSKIESRRLGAFQLRVVSWEELMRRAGAPLHQREWEAQFKFLPLYTRDWDA